MDRLVVRREWPWLLGLYTLALALRWYLIPSGIYGDEAWHYHVSRTWGAPVENVHILDLDDVTDGRALFLWRLGFFIPLTPGALISFDAFRALFSAYAALLSPLVFVILRELFVRRYLAAPAGLAVAISPYFVTWGERVFPDALLGTFLLAALWCWLRGSTVGAAGFSVLAMWCKEVAIVFVATLVLLQIASDHPAGTPRAWPPRISKRTLALLAICPIGLLPLLFALQGGVAFPGWSNGTLQAAHVDLLFGSAWLVPLILIGLCWRRTRFLAVLALAHPAFYILHNVIRGRQIEVWYHVVPQLLALLAAVQTLDEAAVRSFANHRGRIASRTAVAAVAVLLLVGPLVPSEWEAKRAFAPASLVASPSLTETIDFEQGRDRSLHEALASVEGADWEAVFVVDVGWYFHWYPFGHEAKLVRKAYTDWEPEDGSQLPRWVNTAENLTRVTFLYKLDLPLNLALRDTYTDCVHHENVDYVVLRPSACPGRVELLATNYHARQQTAE
ncbi:MAG TPA: hypothetical protein VGB18_07680 [Candidatus Thermoplasmatota archaeon]